MTDAKSLAIISACFSTLGVHRNTVSKWWWQYEHGGEAGLYQEAGGRQVGKGLILSPEEEVQAAMTGHFPDGDESGLSSNEYGGRGYAPIGHTPEIRPSQKHRDRLNFIASLSAAGHVQFMLYTSSLTVTVFIQFLERLIGQPTQKLFWIVDRHPIHRNPEVSAWLTQHGDQIELFYLPSYSPQLNPTEYLNGDVKQGVHDKPASRSMAQFKQRLMSHLRKLQKLPARIRSYFKHPAIAYAAL
jgi:transposase